jgi:hypothetical protein
MLVFSVAFAVARFYDFLAYPINQLTNKIKRSQL